MWCGVAGVVGSLWCGVAGVVWSSWCGVAGRAGFNQLFKA